MPSSKLRELATLAITKAFSDGYSGVVITGFGEKEVFPKLVEYRTDLVIFNKVRKTKLQEYKQKHFDSGKVMSFAQDEIIRTILEGIRPKTVSQIKSTTCISSGSGDVFRNCG